MRILITGSSGMLGRELAERLHPAHELILRDIDGLDVRDASAVYGEIKRLSPEVVINCAAATDVDWCEYYPEQAFAVNAEGARNIAEACAVTGALMCHLSTDYVFDGSATRPYTEQDIPHPISVYGRSKLAGERYVREIVSRHIIVRTSWLYGVYGKNFIETILRLSETRHELRVVNDQTGSPTYAEDLAWVIEQLVTLPAPYGTYHVCNTGICTWHDFAVAALSLAGRQTAVVPITTEELGRAAPRPRFSVLDNAHVSATLGITLRHWCDALTAYMYKRKGVYR
ncbi:MAG: dTDP-4-dehydrorhamnose reductase [Desulfobacterota bacterium]|nr:dTDP-4-dehydrorhamnose reductase [Thermodesulfobacteriota bacterium]